MMMEIRRLGPIGAEIVGVLAFGKAEKSSEARAGPASSDNEDRYAPLRTVLSTPVKAGGNIVIASHGNPFVAVIRPLGKDFEIIARVRHDAWRALQAKN